MASTLKQIGLAYKGAKKFKESIESFEKSLNIQQKESIEYAATLNNIGIVYSDQKKYNEAIEKYTECLKIK